MNVGQFVGTVLHECRDNLNLQKKIQISRNSDKHLKGLCHELKTFNCLTINLSFELAVIFSGCTCVVVS
jgi:hypothetical protein